MQFYLQKFNGIILHLSFLTSNMQNRKKKKLKPIVFEMEVVIIL